MDAREAGFHHKHGFKPMGIKQVHLVIDAEFAFWRNPVNLPQELQIEKAPAWIFRSNYHLCVNRDEDIQHNVIQNLIQDSYYFQEIEDTSNECDS